MDDLSCTGGCLELFLLLDPAVEEIISGWRRRGRAGRRGFGEFLLLQFTLPGGVPCSEAGTNFGVDFATRATVSG